MTNQMVQYIDALNNYNKKQGKLMSGKLDFHKSLHHPQTRSLIDYRAKQEASIATAQCRSKDMLKRSIMANYRTMGYSLYQSEHT